MEFVVPSRAQGRYRNKAQFARLVGLHAVEVRACGPVRLLYVWYGGPLYGDDLCSHQNHACACSTPPAGCCRTGACLGVDLSAGKGAGHLCPRAGRIALTPWRAGHMERDQFRDQDFCRPLYAGSALAHPRLEHPVAGEVGGGRELALQACRLFCIPSDSSSDHAGVEDGARGLHHGHARAAAGAAGAGAV